MTVRKTLKTKKSKAGADQNRAPVVFLTTIFPKGAAYKFAKSLVQNKYAACINVVPSIKSFYFWKGRLNEENEFLIIGKTTTTKFNALKKDIKALHPYQVPELISFSITDGLPEYLEWIKTTLA